MHPLRLIKMEYFLIALSVLIVILTIATFFFSQRYFLYSLFVFYPVIAQCVDINLDLPGLVINMSQLYGLVTFCLILIGLIVHLKAKVIFVLAFVLFAYCMSTALFSLSPYATVLASMKFGSWILLIPLASCLMRKESDVKILSDFAYITVTIIIVSLILSRFGIYGHSAEYGYYGHDLRVAIGSYFNQSGIAAALALAIPILFIKGLLGEKKAFYQTGVFIAFIGILMTYVRGPFVAVVLSYSYLFYLSLRHSLKKVALKISMAILIGIIALSTFCLLNPETAFLRWKMEQQLIQGNNIAKLGSGRVGDLLFFTNYYMNRMDTLQKLFGLGLGTDELINPSRKLAHNTFLQLLIGCGFIGTALFALYLSYIFIIFRGFLRKKFILEKRLFCAVGMMAWFALILLLLRGGGAQIFPYFMSSIQIGAIIGLLLNSETNEPGPNIHYGID